MKIMLLNDINKIDLFENIKDICKIYNIRIKFKAFFFFYFGHYSYIIHMYI